MEHLETLQKVIQVYRYTMNLVEDIVILEEKKSKKRR